MESTFTFNLGPNFIIYWLMRRRSGSEVKRDRFKTHILERITIIIIIPFRLKQFRRNFLKENFLCGTLVNPLKEIQIRKKQCIKTLLGSVESSARSILLLSLSSCGPGFESQAHAIYYTFHVTYWIYVVFWL